MTTNQNSVAIRRNETSRRFFTLHNSKYSKLHNSEGENLSCKNKLSIPFTKAAPNESITTSTPSTSHLFRNFEEKFSD